MTNMMSFKSVFSPTPTHTVIGVVGLGYVGLPVACEFARAGFRVIGVDLKAERVAQINAGINPIEGNEPGLAELLAEVIGSGRLWATTDYADLHEAHIITVNVETPVDDKHMPQYHALRAASHSLSQVIQPETLIIIESTVAPGTTLQVVKPILEASGKWQVASGKWQESDVQSKIYLGMCPERVMPGLLLQNLRNLSRACGGCTPEVAQAMVALYRHIIPNADLDAIDILTAELVKTTENAYRDVQIAFANEVALICETVGGDVWKVRQLVNKSPGRNMLLAGAGVGGHCIPKDPWLLAAGLNLKLKMENEKLGGEESNSPFSILNSQFPMLIPAARAVNEFMPQHMFDMVAARLTLRGKAIAKARVLVLGYSYLENSDDTRDTPSEKLVAHLQASGATVVIHDPFVAQYRGDVYAAATGCDAAVLMVKHTAYLSLDFHKLKTVMTSPLLIDGRKAYDALALIAAGFDYSCVGVGN